MQYVRLLWLIFTSLSSSVILAEDQVQFYTHSINNAVAENQQGELVGVPKGGRRAVDVEIVRWILNDLGIKSNIKELPFKRALKKAQTEDNNALFNILRTIDRNKTMQWVGPLQTHRSYFYEAADRPTLIQSLADAADVKSICVLSGNVHQTMLSKFGFDNLVLAATYGQCVELLLRGRVSLMPAGEHPVFLHDPEIEGKLQRTSVMINSSDGYMGLSLNIEKAFVQKLQASLDKLKLSDDYSKIMETYSEEHDEHFDGHNKE